MRTVFEPLKLMAYVLAVCLVLMFGGVGHVMDGLEAADLLLWRADTSETLEFYESRSLIPSLQKATSLRGLGLGQSKLMEEELAKRLGWDDVDFDPEFSASPSGSGLTCSVGSPCAINTLLCGGGACNYGPPGPDDRLSLRGVPNGPCNLGASCTYDAGVSQGVSSLNGSLGHNIIIQPYQNEWVDINCDHDASLGACWKLDAGVSGPHNSYVTIMGPNLNFMNSSNCTRQNSIVSPNPAPCAADGKVHLSDHLQVSAPGSKIIGVNFDNGLDAIFFTGMGDGGEIAENIFLYSGDWALDRGHGHGLYVRNQVAANLGCQTAPRGTGGRMLVQENSDAFSFSQADQYYSTDSSISVQCIDSIHNGLFLTGHKKYPTSTWPAVPLGGDFPVQYGTSGAAATNCDPTVNAKAFCYGTIDGEQTYQTTANPFNMGGTKGWGFVTMINSYWIGGNAGFWSKQDANGVNNVLGPATIGGVGNENTFIGVAAAGSWSGFTQASQPNNFWLASLPTSGTKIFAYASRYFAGYGRIRIYNWGHASTISFNPATAGMFVGEKYKLFHYQAKSVDSAHDPFSGTPALSGTWSSGNLTVNMTGYTTQTIAGNGVDGLDTPPESGPEFVEFFLRLDTTAGGGATPTPTITNTPSNTPSLTNTPSRTPTNTPSITPTPSSTNTNTPSNTATNTPSRTPTNTPSQTPTNTASNTPTATATATVTPSQSVTPSNTPVNSNTPTNTPSNTATATNTPSNTNTPSSTNTNTPSNTPTFTNTPSATRTPTATPTSTPSATFTPTVTRTPAATQSLADNFSNCPVVAPMAVTLDSLSPVGSYVSSSGDGRTVPANGGSVTCTFTIPTTGIWYVWIQTRTSDGTADSMYGTLNSEVVTTTTHIFDMGEQRFCSDTGYDKYFDNKYHWHPWNDRSHNCTTQGCTTSCITGYPKSTNAGAPGLQLTAGTNTMTFTGREAGAKLVRYIITNDPNFDPSVIQSVAPRTGSRPFRLIPLIPTRPQ